MTDEPHGKDKEFDRTADEFPEYSDDYVSPPKPAPTVGQRAQATVKTAPVTNDEGKDAGLQDDGRIRRIVTVVVLGILALLAVPFFRDTAHLRLDDPMFGETRMYKKDYHFYPQWPFVMSYYILPPAKYDPRKSYPLVMALHGISAYTYAGHFLATPQFRRAFPAFVYVPVISRRAMWATPRDARLRLSGSGHPLSFDALPHAVGLIGELVKKYSIDLNRIYITGHSAGAIGTYAAVEKYPSIFAGAVTSAGYWDVAAAPRMTGVPILAMHGSADRMLIAAPDRMLAKAISDNGGKIIYKELPGRGHGIWKEVYANPAVWSWLFKQKKDG